MDLDFDVEIHWKEPIKAMTETMINLREIWKEITEDEI